MGLKKITIKEMKVKKFDEFILNENWSSLRELSNKVMTYDKGIEYLGRTYATIFGPRYRDVSQSTMEGDVSWTSTDINLLQKINKELFNNKGSVVKYREGEPDYVLFIELSKLGLKY